MLRLFPTLMLEPMYFDLNFPHGSTESFSELDHGTGDSCSKYIETALEKNHVELVHTCALFAGEAFLHARHANKHLKKVPWVHSNFATLSQERHFAEAKPISIIAGEEMYQREKQVNQEADLIVAGSYNDAAELHTLFGLDSHRVVVIYRGIDHGLFYPRQEHRSIDVISCGRMVPIKDFPFLIESMHILIKRFPGIVRPGGCVIVGGTETERAQLKLPQLVSRARLSGIVRFIDATSQMQLAGLLAKARVFVGTSMHETFGLLPVEARACGTPTVVRDNSSYPEIPGARSGGLVSSNTSPTDFAEDIGRLLSTSEADWHRLSAGAIESSRTFSWNAYAESHKQAYLKLHQATK